MGKYESLATNIIENVGGRENINSVSHCVTRLRFYLKDEELAQDDVLKSMDGVVTVMKAGGQYQVVIGNHVSQVYDDVLKVSGLSSDIEEEQTKDLNLFNRIIDVISGSFQPFLGVLAASGMIKGFNSLFLFLSLYAKDSGTDLFLTGIGDAIFKFLPIIVGATSAKKFKLPQFIGMTIGAALCYPALQLDALSSTREPIMTLFNNTIFESPVYFKAFGLPIIANNYLGSVIPVLIIVWFASYVQKLVKKFVPEVIQSFFVPFFVLIISLTCGFLVIGPAIVFATNLLQAGFNTVYGFSPIIYGILLGGLWQVLVIFGLHWSVVPLHFIMLQNQGFSNIISATYTASFAQTAVVLAMYFKLKDKKIKSLTIPAFISGVCGVTEPAIYGITLPKKKPFYISLVVAALGGGLMNAFDIKSYTAGGLGIFGLVNFIDGNNDASGMYYAIMNIIIVAILAFLITFFFWKDEENADVERVAPQKQSPLTSNKEVIASPVSGKIIPLKNLQDKAFSEGAIGHGVAIDPSSGKVFAPCNGTIMTVFPTKHAIGIISDNGAEILIHIGMDTVKLDGQYFESHISEGQKVKKGDLLVTVDLEKIKAAGYSMETPIVITNTADYLDIVQMTDKEVIKGDDILTLLI